MDSGAGLDNLTRSQRIALRELLILATAVAGGPGDRDELIRVLRAAPVNALPRAAALHRADGAVLRGLNDIDEVPSDVRAQLEEQRQHNAMRHLLLTAALNEIGRSFDHAGLSWVAMKGPVVAVLYPDVGDRRYGDLDLLVERHDYPRAIDILEDLGYEHMIHNWARAEEMLAGQVGLSRGAVTIDLHWHLHYSHQDRRPFNFDPAAMISRSRTLAVSGTVAPALDPVDNVISLAFHAARSDGHRLMWLKDIERSISVDKPDMDDVVRRCRVYRCAPPVGVILGRSSSLLGAEVPDEIIRALTPTTLRATDHLVCAIVHPIQLHERPTVTRMVTRSMRSSVATTLADVPMRGVRWAHRHLRQPRLHETDDPAEKASYLRAVSRSIDR